MIQSIQRNRILRSGRQNGAALVVGLVVLLMLTLLGVSSMNMTSLELRISGNVQNRNLAFQTADSMNDAIFYDAIQRFDFITQADQTINQATVVTNPDNGSTTTISTTTTGSYGGEGSGVLCPGNSFSLSCNIYQISSVATESVSNASSTVVQGFSKVGRQLANFGQ